MKSVKPGRGPSFMSGVVGLIASAFVAIWTVSASSMGAPGVFTLFGVLGICMGLGIAIYNFANATRKNRFSTFDITDEREEPDPLNARFHGEDEANGEDAAEAENPAAYCPSCGAPLKEGFAFCPRCGKRAR